jgi:hypothetical protein
MNNKRKIALIVAAIIVALLLLICTSETENSHVKSKTVTKPNVLNDLLNLKNQIIKNLSTSIEKRDNLIKRQKTLLSSYNHEANIIHENVIKNAPDTCFDYINRVYDSFLKSDSLKTNYILLQDSSLLEYKQIVGQLNDVISIKNYQISTCRDSINYLQEDNNSLEKKVKSSKFKGNVKTIGASIGSFFIGLGISTLK